MNTKKLFTWLALAASVICLAAFAWANGNEVIVDDGNFNTLQEKVNTANPGDIIVITEDIDISDGKSLDIPADKTITLSLDEGVTLRASDDALVFAINNKGNLTIAGSGTIEAVCSESGEGACAVLNGGSGDVTVTGSVKVSAHATGKKGQSIAIANLSMNGGTVGNIIVGNIIVAGSATVSAKDAEDAEDGESGAIAIYNYASTGNNAGSVTVMDSAVLSADSAGTAWAIYNYAEGGTVGAITVAGNACVRAQGHESEKSYAYAIRNWAVNGGTVGNVTVAGSATVSAMGATDNRCVYCNNEFATILSGDFAGKLYVEDGAQICIHGGRFASKDLTDWSDADITLAPDCTSEDIDSTKIVHNCVAASLNKDEIRLKLNDSDTVTASLIPSGSPVDHTDVTSADIPDLPKGLSFTSQGGELTITNTGCEPGVYEVTVVIGNNHNRAASTVLTITTGDAPQPEENAVVSTPGELKTALVDPNVKQITLSSDYSGTVSDEVTVSGDKTLIVSTDQTILLSNGGQFTVPGSALLDIKSAGTVSKDAGPIFDVMGRLSLDGGRYYVKDGKYFTEDTNPENVNIAEGTKFYFGKEESAAEFTKYLAEDSTLKSVGDGWYEVTRNSKGTPAAKPVTPVISGDEKLNDQTASADAHAYTDKNEAASILPEGFEEKDVTADTEGQVTINPETATDLLKTTDPSSEATPSDISALPIISADAGEEKAGKTIMTSYAVSDDFFGNITDPSKLCVWCITKDGQIKQLTCVPHIKDAKDGTYTVQNEDGTMADKIEKGKTYIISLFVADGGELDLDSQKDGKIAISSFIDTSKENSGKNGGSSVGCNAGFAALALMGLAFVPTRRKK